MTTHYDDIEPLREILYRSLVRYLTVRPRGFLLDKDRRLEPVISARILDYGGARTLYRERKPACRSLDGLHAIDDHDKRCHGCPQHKACTPQVRLDLMVEQRPYRLLLAYSSARNFLEYVDALAQRSLDYRKLDHRVEVRNRGSWGELLFHSATE